MIFSNLGKILAIAAATVIGLVEGAIFFSDPGPGETIVVRLLMALFLAVPAPLLRSSFTWISGPDKTLDQSHPAVFIHVRPQYFLKFVSQAVGPAL